MGWSPLTTRMRAPVVAVQSSDRVAAAGTGGPAVRLATLRQSATLLAISNAPARAPPTSLGGAAVCGCRIRPQVSLQWPLR